MAKLEGQNSENNWQRGNHYLDGFDMPNFEAILADWQSKNHRRPGEEMVSPSTAGKIPVQPIQTERGVTSGMTATYTQVLLYECQLGFSPHPQAGRIEILKQALPDAVVLDLGSSVIPRFGTVAYDNGAAGVIAVDAKFQGSDYVDMYPKLANQKSFKEYYRQTAHLQHRSDDSGLNGLFNRGSQNREQDMFYKIHKGDILSTLERIPTAFEGVDVVSINGIDCFIADNQLWHILTARHLQRVMRPGTIVAADGSDASKYFSTKYMKNICPYTIWQRTNEPFTD
ncbi:MAG: hypothetical protein AAB373_05520 [Patescibacteria group bacterium]